MGVPVLIAVRDCPTNEQNPYTATEVYHNITRLYDGEDVEVIIIPDIESVNYGRGVGYEVNEHVPPANIGAISATKIRAAQEAENRALRGRVQPPLAKDMVIEMLREERDRLRAALEDWCVCEEGRPCRFCHTLNEGAK